MPLIDNYLLDNYLIDGPSGDTTTRETIAANRSVGTMLANMTGVTLSNQFLVPSMNKFLDVYSPEPSKSISKSGSYLLDVVVQASTTMFFTTSQYLEASFVLLDSKLEAIKFFASRWYGTDQSGVSPSVTLQLYGLSIDKEKRKLYYTGFGSASGGSGQFLSTTAVDIPASFNLDGPIYVQVGGEKNYTSAGGNHTLTIERRSLTVLTS